MNPIVNNLFAQIPKKIPEELFQTLFANASIRIERIISQGHCSPLRQWYDQANDEWVILLEGQATLYFEKKSEPVALKAGDYLFIPAHTKHRVHWTHPERQSIWLAIHLLSVQVPISAE